MQQFKVDRGETQILLFIFICCAKEIEEYDFTVWFWLIDWLKGWETHSFSTTVSPITSNLPIFLWSLTLSSTLFNRILFISRVAENWLRNPTRQPSRFAPTQYIQDTQTDIILNDVVQGIKKKSIWNEKRRLQLAFISRWNYNSIPSKLRSQQQTTLTLTLTVEKT